MSQRRSTTPLFELLDQTKPIEPLPQPGQARGESPEPADPTPRAVAGQSVEPKPLLSEGVGRPAVVGRLIVLPVPFALIGLGVLVVIGAVLWATAYSMGERRARSEEQAKALAMGGSIVDPIAPAGEPANRPAPATPDPTAPGNAENDPEPGSNASRDPKAAQAADPRLTDAREAGRNYLRLATLDRATAVEAVDRLIAGGLQAFAVPLESSARRGNDPSRFVVYLADGFAGAEFSASRSERAALERRAKGIGSEWVREGGPTGFQQPNWEKFVP